jgi:3',5'-cyclic-nucleotide phosphodiesterase
MNGCRVAYNSFVLYHNFRHAVDVLQSVFYFLVRIGTLPPYPKGSESPPLSNDKSPIAKLLGSFEALTLLISAIGHDVGHPGVNNMFLVKLNAPLAQLYNDQSVLEAFHCAAYSQILRRHWPAAFHDKAIRKLMISTILATDMGVHSEYMSHLGNLQSKIHESKVTDGWTPKEIDQYRTLACGLLIKCADISNVARPWAVAEKWTYLLQKEFAKQGEMESAVGMETTLFGGPPELGNMLKLANGQIGFMTIFAHPLFYNVADVIPAMSFAAEEIITNKGVWFTRAEKEKMKAIIKKGTGLGDGGAVSPRSLSPSGKKHADRTSYFPSSPLGNKNESPRGSTVRNSVAGDEPIIARSGNTTPKDQSRRSSLQAVAGVAIPIGNDGSRRSSAASGRGRRASRDHGVNGTHNSNGVAFTTPSFSEPSENTDPNRQPSTTALLGTDGTTSAATSSEELNDTRRDEGVSMRAGSTALPVSEDQARSQLVGTSSPMSPFRFATSDIKEPVREYDPEKDYLTPKEMSKSFPIDSVSSKQQQEMAQQARDHVPSSEASTPNAVGRPGSGDANHLTPSHSTEATSYLSDKSDRSPSQKQKDLDSKRSRAISAPLDMASPNLRSTYSVSSTQSGSYGSGKEYQNMLNGIEDGDSPSRGRKASTRTLGRKRSRIKMGLMFWKSKEEKDRAQEEADEGYAVEGTETSAGVVKGCGV